MLTTPRTKGDYGHRVLVDVFEPTAGDSAPTTTPFGLSLMCTWLYLDWWDEDGRLFEAHRTILGQEASVGFLLNEPRDGALRKYHPPAGEDFFSGTVITTVEGDTHTIRSRPQEAQYATGAPFSCTRTLDNIDYVEGDAMSFSGRRIGPGLQFYVPTGETPLFYTSLQHRVSGTSFGRKGEGFLWWDQCYLPPGVTWRQSDYFRWAELAWTYFGNEYEDGSMELGHVCHGADGFSFSVITDGEGNVLHKTSDVVAGDIVFKPNTFPQSMTYTVDGVPWDWTALPGGDCPDMASGTDHYRSGEGALRRRGDSRKAVLSTAYNEFFPGSIKAWQQRSNA